MAVKIRLNRVGKTNSPCFKLVAIDARRKRDGGYLDYLGTYNPLTGTLVQFHKEKIDKWINVGAICTDSAKKIIKMHAKQ